MRKRHYHEFIMKHFVAASCPRTPDVQNYIMVTYIDDPEPWEKASIGADGRGLANNIRTFYRHAMDNDLVCAPHFVDPQADRSDPGAHGTSPALRIVQTHRRGHRRQRRQGDRHRLRLRRFPPYGRVLPAGRQGRPDHLRRLPRQHSGRDHRLPRKRREGRSDRASARLAGRRARFHGAVRQRPDPVEIRLPYRQSRPRQALSAARVRLGALSRAGAPGGPGRADGRPRDPDLRASRHRQDRGRASRGWRASSAFRSRSPPM